MAEAIGLALQPTLPARVAAVRLSIALAADLHLDLSKLSSGRHGTYLERVFPDWRTQVGYEAPVESDREAEAWIDHVRSLQRIRNLEELKPSPGDVVRRRDGTLWEVSSIGADGAVFMKGGRGNRAWPDLISIVARNEDASKEAVEAQIEARNNARRFASTTGASIARANDLRDFLAAPDPGTAEIEELERIVDTAEDERPIQAFLEAHPNLLTALIGGTECFCLPQKRLGSEYVPDFIVGNMDSLGFHWYLIELETPNSDVYLRGGIDLDQFTRKGVGQIKDWREWLHAQIAYARQPRRENGLGLYDIRNTSPAYVIVGRRHRLGAKKEGRRLQEADGGILIHTYDWLIARLRSVAAVHGPPAANPHLLRADWIDDPDASP